MQQRASAHYGRATLDSPSVHLVFTAHTPSSRLWPPEQLLQFARLGPAQVRQLASHLRRMDVKQKERERGS